MPVRTTEDAVRDIIEVDDAALSDAGLAPFIATASHVVDRYCDVATNPSLATTHDPPYDEETLEEIERYLAAHFYASSRDPRLVSDTVSSLQSAYQMKTDLYLGLTHYGQHAIVLDTYGGLAALQQTLTDDSPSTRRGITIGLMWGGKEYDDDGRAIDV